jgi:DNA-binding transcriptional LysR family regulator
MKSLADGQTGSLNIAAMPGPVSMIFPRFIAGQLDRDSGISVSILARSSSQIAELARAQSIDFGFADAPDDAGSQTLYAAEIISANCSVALPAGHVLTEKAAISLEDLAAEPMGSLQATHSHQRDIDAVCQARGLTLSVMVESQTFLPILQFVSSGLCCSIIDPLTVVHVNSAPDLAAAVTIRPLSTPIRYRYAIFEPKYRPVSVLARQTMDAWREEVLHLLRQTGADPEVAQSIPASTSP